MTDLFLAAIPPPPTDALHLGPLRFGFYGLMIALGVVAAIEIGRRRWVDRGGDPDDISSIAIWAVPAGLIGSRAYHVLTDWKRYRGDWLRAFEIWSPGLGIPGGLLLGVLVGYLVAKKRGITDLNGAVSAVIPGIPVAQAIGRLGNYFNQEIFGPPTSLPWGLEVDPEFRPEEHADSTTFHPTFLYEGLWNLALAVFLIWLDRRGLLRRWQMIPVWIMGYGVGRFLIESLRTDPASEILGVRVNHWVSGGAVVIGLIWYLWAGRRADPVADVDEPETDDAPEADDDETDVGVMTGDDQ